MTAALKPGWALASVVYEKRMTFCPFLTMGGFQRIFFLQSSRKQSNESHKLAVALN